MIIILIFFFLKVKKYKDNLKILQEILRFLKNKFLHFGIKIM